MSNFYGFNEVDANGMVEEVFEKLQRRVRELLNHKNTAAAR